MGNGGAMELERISDLIDGQGPKGKQLQSLKESPRAHTALRFFATRVGIEVEEELEYSDFLLCKMRDSSSVGFKFPSPFAAICLDNRRVASQEDAQDLFEVVKGALEEEDLHYRPVILIHTAELGHLESYLDYTTIPFVLLDLNAFIELLLAKPPRLALLRRIRQFVSLRSLNPYVYKGPIGTNLFRGREEELKILTALRTSYALVGPRATGKTSLMNRAYEQLVNNKEKDEIAIRVEHSPGMSETVFAKAIIERFVEHHGAHRTLLARPSLSCVERLIHDFSRSAMGANARRRQESKPITLFIDEADELVKRHPNIVDLFRRCHNNGSAHFIFVGYKELRKALNDRRELSLSNLAQPLKLGGLSPQASGQLISDPMIDLGVILEDKEKIVESIHYQTNGSPSRIQLVCHHLINILDKEKRRRLRFNDVENVMMLNPIQTYLSFWLHESTSKKEQWLAQLISLIEPCEQKKIIELATRCLHGVSEHVFETEILDLVAADILNYLPDGRLGFSFPAMKSRVQPQERTEQALKNLSRYGADIFSD